MYCEKCNEDKPSDNCQQLDGMVVCWDCFENFISYCDSLADAEKERE